MGKDRLNYIRGQRGNEEKNGGPFRNRSSRLGDIVNSTPIVIGMPEQQYPVFWGNNAPENNSSYQQFRMNNMNRLPVIYVGANDGVLHAFSSTTGNEILGYVPSILYSKLPQLTNKNYSHQYFVDGSPTIIDAFLGGQWRTMLVSGLNGGGQGIFALDVTDPSQFSEANAANIVKWEFTDANDADLGFTYSQPVIVRMANEIGLPYLVMDIIIP